MPQHTERRSNTSRPGRRGPSALRTVAIALLAVLLTSVIPGATPTAAADELSEARARQERLEARIAAQKRQVARLDRLQSTLTKEIGSTTAALRSINADLADVRKQVAKVKTTVAEVKREYARLVDELAALDAELSTLQEQQAQKRRELRERMDELAARIRDAYDAERTSMVEILLSADSFTDVLVEVSAYTDMAERDKELADQIERDRAALAALEVSVQATRDQTDLLRKETADQKRELDRRMADLKSAQRKLRSLERATERELAKQRNAYAKLAKNESALRKAIAADAAAQKKLQADIDGLVRAQQQRGKVPSEFNGTFIWPHAGRITQEFGCTGFAWEPPLGNCANFHRGIDIAAPRWRPVRAAGDGVVVFAGPNPYDPYPKAWIVIIAHSSSLRTWYAHVDNERRPTVRAGQSVKRGQVIAYVGSTGRSTGYHTDWRVELRGQFVNPRLFL